MHSQAQRSVVLSILAAAIVAVVPAQAADVSPEQGVAFVDEGAFALAGEDGTKLEVEVFNASDETRTLAVSLAGAATTHVLVETKEQPAGPGKIATFTLTLEDAPPKQLSGVVRATSDAGALTTRSIIVGDPRSGAADETATYPKSLSFGDVVVGRTATIDVPALAGEPESEVPVGHVSAGGRAVKVTRTGDVLSLGKLPQHGSYTGTVDLTPGVDGGDVDLSVDAHDHLGWAALVIFLGLLLAALTEFFLRRKRPEWILARQLRAVERDVVRRQDEAVGKLPPGGWSIPLLYDAADPSSLLAARTNQITESLENAPTNAQRDKWGPDGDKTKELETEVESYGKLLDTLVAVAHAWVGFVGRLDADDQALVAGSPLSELVGERLAARTLKAGSLDRETKAADGLLETVSGVAALHARYVRLEVDAQQIGDTGAAEQARDQRVALIRSATNADDVEAFIGEARTLAKDVYGPVEPEEAAPPAPATARSIGPYSLARMLHATSPGDDAATSSVVSVPRDPGAVGWFKRNFMAGDLGFLAVALVIALLTGLSALYFGDDDTFGGLGDYVTAFVWGSTATAGVALARRLVPGTFKSLAGE